MSAVLKEGTDALAALLAYVAQVRDRQLDDIRSTNEAQCRSLLDAARGRAREQIRQALREARRDADAQIALARAGAQARLRRARQALTSAALAGVQDRVQRALAARWADPAARAAWIAMALADAARHLPAGSWIVTHPAQASVPASAVLPEGVTLEARPDAALDAGVRIACGGAQVDATAAGLLRARERIAALWLGELERRRGSAPPDAGARGQA